MMHLSGLGDVGHVLHLPMPGVAAALARDRDHAADLLEDFLGDLVDVGPAAAGASPALLASPPPCVVDAAWVTGRSAAAATPPPGRAAPRSPGSSRRPTARSRRPGVGEVLLGGLVEPGHVGLGRRLAGSLGRGGGGGAAGDGAARGAEVDTKVGSGAGRPIGSRPDGGGAAFDQAGPTSPDRSATRKVGATSEASACPARPAPRARASAAAPARPPAPCPGCAPAGPAPAREAAPPGSTTGRTAHAAAARARADAAAPCEPDVERLATASARAARADGASGRAPPPSSSDR